MTIQRSEHRLKKSLEKALHIAIKISKGISAEDFKKDLIDFDKLIIDAHEEASEEETLAKVMETGSFHRANLVITEEEEEADLSSGEYRIDMNGMSELLDFFEE